MVRRSSISILIFVLELGICAVLSIAARSFLVARSSSVREVQIPASSVRPELAFACEMDTPELQSLFSKPEVVADLRRLNARVSLSLTDLSPGRAQVVRNLNAAGVRVTAWMSLPREQGYYLNSGNAGEAAIRFADFQKWTAAEGLRWSGIGLDIEPGIQEFGSIPRAAVSVVRRLFEPRVVGRARAAYADLISQIHRAGYRVETYQFPFIADQRAVNSTLLERLFGIVDVRGDDEVLMLYSSFHHSADSALIWQYGPSAQLIVVGVTAGDPESLSTFRPLSFEELSRDLIVADHFAPVVGIYNLESCVRRGFLPRLIALDWTQPVTISEEANHQVLRLRARIQSVLWTLARLPYFAGAILLIDLWFFIRRRQSRRI